MKINPEKLKSIPIRKLRAVKERELHRIGALNLPALRKIERDLGVYLDEPVEALRCPKEQFAVYDEDMQFVADIVSDRGFFEDEELRTKIKELFQ